MSPSGLGGSGGGCIIRERGDWREAARLPALSPGENSKFGGGPHVRPQIGDDWRMAKSSCNCLFCRCHVFCPPVIAVLKNSHNLLYRDTLNGRCRGNPRGDSLGDSYANYIAVAGSAGSLPSRTRRRGGSGRHAARGWGAIIASPQHDNSSAAASLMTTTFCVGFRRVLWVCADRSVA